MSDSTSFRPASPVRHGFWATLRVAIVCATIAFIAWQFTRRSAAPPPPRLWTPVVVSGKGHELVKQPATRRMEFWTPSARTKDLLARNGGTVRPQDKWEVLASDEPVDQFGSLLRTNANVKGYRRTEVWGHGSTQLKPGWWWTMTVATNYTVQHLITAYRDFWKSSNSLFVEVVENPGGD